MDLSIIQQKAAQFVKKRKPIKVEVITIPKPIVKVSDDELLAAFNDDFFDTTKPAAEIDTQQTESINRINPEITLDEAIEIFY